MKNQGYSQLIIQLWVKIYRKILNILSVTVNCIVDLYLLFVPEKIFITGYFERKWGKLCPNNWGDDINVYFLQELTGEKICLKNTSLIYRRLPLHNYGCIGSILGRNTDKYSEIWGSGLISGTINPKRIPAKIHSVRGPLTREVLVNNGVQCPEKFGDPALLISQYYRPNIQVKYKLGIIPHIVDLKNEIIQEYIKMHPDVLVINMQTYSHWHDIPDQVLSCEKIISSSLHGLIVSDSYGIPNAWAKFSDTITGGDFKYHDYFASVGRSDIQPTCINTIEDLESLANGDAFNNAAKIDYSSIINACPFSIVR